MWNIMDVLLTLSTKIEDGAQQKQTHLDIMSVVKENLDSVLKIAPLIG